MDEYIVINKEAFIKAFSGEHRPMIENLLNIMGKPLNPIIEDALEHGFKSFNEIDRNYDPSNNQEGIDEMKKEYIDNLKI